MPNTRRRPRSLGEALDRRRQLDQLLARIDIGELASWEIPAALRADLVARAERLQRRKPSNSGRAGSR